MGTIVGVPSRSPFAYSMAGWLAVWFMLMTIDNCLPSSPSPLHILLYKTSKLELFLANYTIHFWGRKFSIAIFSFKSL